MSRPWNSYHPELEHERASEAWVPPPVIRRHSWRLPFYLAWIGFVAVAVVDMACPAAVSTPLVVGPYAAETVTIRLDKYAGFAPLDIRITIRVEPHQDNRGLCVFVAGPLREDSSCFPHVVTDLSQRSVLFTRLPAGDYSFWVVLRRISPAGVATDTSSTRHTAQVRGNE